MIIESPSVCYKERTQTITAIIIHDSNGETLAETLKLYTGIEARDSTHYIIAIDGNIFRCVQDEHQAGHVYNGSLYGQADVNDFSIGIMLIAIPTNTEKYSLEQLEALIALTATLVREYKIPLNRVVGHDHVERTGDPGESFPWFEFLNSVGSIVAQEDISTAPPDD